MGPIYTELVALIHKVGSPNLVRTRLTGLIDNHFEEGSFFPGLINEQYENRRQNSGNPTATWISNQQITDNNNAVDDLIDGFAPTSEQTKGKSFWIRIGAKSPREREQISRAMNDCDFSWELIETDFPGSCGDLFQNIVLQSLQGRLRGRKLKNEINTTRATRHTKYGLGLDKIIGLDNENWFWTRVHFKWKKQKK
jgi:hypothetical protein